MKYPGSSRALQRLQHSFLECVVEHKSGTLEELRSCPPNVLRSDYQIKGTANLEDDELEITFIPKHMGLHVVRIFADTRELCKPVAFTVDQNLDVESLSADKPISSSSNFLRQVAPSPVPSFTQSLPYQMTTQALDPHQSMMINPNRTVNDKVMLTMSGGSHQVGTGFQLQQQQQQQQPVRPPLDENFVRGFTSNPSLSQQYQDYPSSPGEGPTADGRQQRFSHITSQGGSRPVSMVKDDPGFAGDLISMTPDKSTFSELYSKKKAGESMGNVRKNFLTMDYNQLVTPETFDDLRKDIKQMVGSKGLKTKRRSVMSIVHHNNN